MQQFLIACRSILVFFVCLLLMACQSGNSANTGDDTSAIADQYSADNTAQVTEENAQANTPNNSESFLSKSINDIENLATSTSNGIENLATSINPFANSTYSVNHDALTLKNPHKFTVLVVIDQQLEGALTPGQKVTFKIPAGKYQIAYLDLKGKVSDSFNVKIGS
jgi:hypothetical protein